MRSRASSEEPSHLTCKLLSSKHDWHSKLLRRIGIGIEVKEDLGGSGYKVRWVGGWGCSVSFLLGSMAGLGPWSSIPAFCNNTRVQLTLSNLLGKRTDPLDHKIRLSSWLLAYSLHVTCFHGITRTGSMVKSSIVRGWRVVSADRSTCCSCRGLGFGSQYQYGGSSHL